MPAGMKRGSWVFGAITVLAGLTLAGALSIGGAVTGSSFTATSTAGFVGTAATLGSATVGTLTATGTAKLYGDVITEAFNATGSAYMTNLRATSTAVTTGYATTSIADTLIGAQVNATGSVIDSLKVGAGTAQTLWKSFDFTINPDPIALGTCTSSAYAAVGAASGDSAYITGGAAFAAATSTVVKAYISGADVVTIAWCSAGGEDIASGTYILDVVGH